MTTSGGKTLYDFGRNIAGLVTLTLSSAAEGVGMLAGKTVKLVMRHTEITSADGSAYNNYYPGMEFNHASATCSMVDW
jgi:ribosomal protein S5